jgi:AcrR family transcriptional regulator
MRSMAAERTETELAPPRQRERRNAQILDTLEVLLIENALRDLGVEDIASAAGIARTRFYAYYKSKHEAFVAVLARLSSQVLSSYQEPGSWFQRPAELRPRESLLTTFTTVSSLWWQHRAVIREASDMWNSFPNKPNQWREVMNEFIDQISRTIQHERALGIAPPGQDAGQLAEFLMWQTERVLFLRILDNREPDADMAQTMVQVWLRSIYLNDDPHPR